jgi:predicted ATPase
MWAPLWLSYLARANVEIGQFDEARRCIGEAMTTVETTMERWYEAEVNRFAGEIALLSPEPDVAKAETISLVRLRWRVGNRRSPGNCVRR